MHAHTPLPIKTPIWWVLEKILVQEHDAIAILPPIAVWPGKSRELLGRRLLAVSLQSEKLRLTMARTVVQEVGVGLALHTPAPARVKERCSVAASLHCHGGRAVGHLSDRHVHALHVQALHVHALHASHGSCMPA